MRSAWLVLVLVAAFAWFAPSAAAAEGPGGPAPPRVLGEKKGAAGEEAAGEESDNPFKGWIDLTLWSIVVFLLLLFVLSKYAWKPMLQGLEKREQAIRGAVEEAQRARDEAHALRDQLQRDMGQAHEKVRQMFDEAHKAGEQARERMVAEARTDIQTERERLHREIDAARDQALQQIMTRATDLAALVASKALGRQMTVEDHHRLIDEAVADLARSGNGRKR
jgi:F-type H+-transporting ATPase subunit b